MVDPFVGHNVKGAENGPGGAPDAFHTTEKLGGRGRGRAAGQNVEHRLQSERIAVQDEVAHVPPATDRQCRRAPDEAPAHQASE